MHFLGICLVFALSGLATSVDQDPYISLPLKKIKTSADRIREHGYPAETHYVENSEGYIMTLFRIPYSPTLNNENVKKPAVFLQHGLFSCSDCFLLNGPNDCIAYQFVDAGYDLWLGNARGNLYSRNNTKMSTKHPKYWDFSWHEIGAVDIPESIDYILNLTGESGLHYVGHSQGTTVFFVMASTRPEYNEKIKTAHMLAPPIFMGNVSDGLVTNMAQYFGNPGLASDLLGSQEFVPSNTLINRILDTACGGSPRFPEFCKMLFLMWAGNEQNNLNETLLPQVAETHPAGISTNQPIHYMQLYMSNEFRHFDYGLKKNLQKYNQELPPDYPIERITANMYIYYGLSDSSANKQDISRLLDYLPNIKLFHEVPDPTWAHLDFIFAKQVKEVINNPIIQSCDDYENAHQV